MDRPTTAATTTASAYASSLGLTVFGLGVNELAALGGLLLAILTFVINWRYKALHYRLAAKALEAGHVAARPDHR